MSHLTRRLRLGTTGLVALVALTVAALHAQMPPANEPAGGIDLTNLNTTVQPAADFYQFANGGWLPKNPIPADLSRWGSFNEVQERNYVVLHEILESAAAQTSAPHGSIIQKVGDFYASGMDSAKIEADGLSPIAGELKKIDDIKDAAGFTAALAHSHTMGVRSFFNFFAGQDDKKSTDIIAVLRQGGLSLPDRDYYTKEDDRSKELRAKYVEHLTKMFQLIGDDAATAASHAAVVMKIETALATASKTRVELRDPEANYHKMSLAELATLAPDFPWAGYFAGIGLPAPGNINVGQPEFFKAAAAMAKSVPVDDWKVYLRWHLVNDAADQLSSAFVNQNFEFFGKTLNGTKELRPRWKRVLMATDGSLGEALGQLYVEKAFSASAKARAKQLVENLRTTLAARISKLEWMSDATKTQALKKLNAFTVKIGYPDKWRDYTALDLDRSSYAVNAMRASAFEFQRNLAQIGKPVDRSEWGMSPPTVNAYYNPLMNEIVFPAGILQPPFFDANADDAVNYGGIGAVIGHEMTHGFDDQGRQFDADGNLRDWWTPEDGKNYLSRASIVEKQFDGYVVLDSLHVNGKLTLGENIADLGGLTIAYYAMQMALDKDGRPALIDGYTPEQRFFISWATIWRQNIRPENQKVRLVTDPHSPGQFRCNGPLSNMTEFMKAFSVQEGAPMVRSEKAKIW
jgi:putative endopeptidase